MGEYTITPRDEPPWRFTAGDFATRIKHRWPHARVGIGDLPGSPMLLHALIPSDPLSRELGIALDAEGWAVNLDPADPAAAAEFTVWYATQLPGFDPPMYLIPDDSAAGIELRPAMRPDHLLAELAPPPVPRPDPRAVGAVAADLFDRLAGSTEYRRLVEDVRLQRRRWATFTGLPLVAQLDLDPDRDGRPLLREALRVLALRAAVHRITASEDTAATLTVPAPVDDMIRAVLAEYTLCTQISQQLGMRFVRKLTDFDHLGWRRGDYTHQCYRAAGFDEPNDRYWIDADEARRRQNDLDWRYADAGLVRSGTRHTIRFDPVPPPWMVGY